MFYQVAHKGDIAKKLLKENIFRSGKCGQFLSRIFFLTIFTFTLSRTGRPDEERYIQAALKLAEEHDLPLVATNDVAFLAPDDFEAHEIRVAIHDGYTLDDPKRPKRYTEQQYFRSEEEMCDLFADIPSALENTVINSTTLQCDFAFGAIFPPSNFQLVS